MPLGLPAPPRPSGAPLPPPSQLGLGDLKLKRKPTEHQLSFSTPPAPIDDQFKDALRIKSFGSTKPQSIRSYAPKWWIPDEKEDTSIREFDGRHSSYLKRACNVSSALRKDPTSLRMESSTEVAVWELCHNRFFIRECPPPIEKFVAKPREKKKAPPKKPKPWRLIESIWAPRRKYCDAKDFFDPPAVKFRAFDRDWGIAREKHTLDKKIERAAKKIEDAEVRAQYTGEAFGKAMFEYFDLIYQVFFYYSCLGATDDIYSLTNGCYIQVIRECHLANNSVEGLRDADLNLLFEGANAKATKADVYDSKLSLDREEWIAVLSDIILRRHVGSVGLSLSEAMRSFFIDDIARNVPSVCLQDSNQFRAQSCYREEVDMVLQKYKASLTNLFAAFAEGDGAIGDDLKSTKMMDFGEYMQLMDKIEIVDPFIVLRDLRLVFIWSRMFIVNESTLKGRAATLQLHFEDFLEVIVRFAQMMALPTEDELNQAGLPHAGAYLDALKDTPEAEVQFKRLRTLACGEIGGDMDVPIAWKVRQFILWMLYRARGNQGNPEKELKLKEAKAFKGGFVKKAIRTTGEVSYEVDDPISGDEDDDLERTRIAKGVHTAYGTEVTTRGAINAVRTTNRIATLPGLQPGSLPPLN